MFKYGKLLRPFILAVACTAYVQQSSLGQTGQSIARQWNEVLLEAIRHDLSRPTVHARNLFHSAIATYDGWAAFDDTAQPFLLGGSFAGVDCPYDPVGYTQDIAQVRREVISYANYRLVTHRFERSVGADESLVLFDSLMNALGYDPSVVGDNYASGNPAHLGNYLASCIINSGLEDGANEQNNYANSHYVELNPPLLPILPGNPDIIDVNRFQPLGLKTFVDQSGNTLAAGVPAFLSAEWGDVVPFSLTERDQTIYTRDDETYLVYDDPGPPPLLDTGSASTGTIDYQWAFSLVSAWSSHLDPSDGVLWDISPGAIGNNSTLPTSVQEMKEFYDYDYGGDTGRGRAMNPFTGQPYAPQIIPRGDYTRVLAEFWADGPDSETPPGHWFTILNYVSDHPLFEKRFRGAGEELDDLEWDAKAYFALGGGVHDAAVTAWSVKGWYDYVRPISAIRWMADRGQCSDPGKANYSPDGITLVPGVIELVEAGDPLAGLEGENISKIKVHAWRGPDYIIDPDKDEAGVGWILAENWWPYQRPTFVTPPFAGYVSGHSVFSRTAAEILTKLTGDEYFPGGIGEFLAKKNEFLVFEEGPSVDVTLQWATYRDASDQTSLSRIWGGIHPPVDDIPGRLIGVKVGVTAFALAEQYFEGNVDVAVGATRFAAVYPNPVSRGSSVRLVLNRTETGKVSVYDVTGRQVMSESVNSDSDIDLRFDGQPAGTYYVRFSGKGGVTTSVVTVL